MKNLIYAGIFLLMLGALVYLGDRLKRENSINEELTKELAVLKRSDAIPMQAEIIKRQVDDKGAEHVTVVAPPPVQKTIELSIENKQRIDSLITQLGIKEKQLQSVTVVKAKLETDLLAAKAVSVQNAGKAETVYEYKDKYLHATYIPAIDTAGSFKFTYDGDFNISQYSKRKGFLGLGGKENLIDIYSTDPRVKIKGVEKLTIKPKVNNFGLRMQARGIYIPEADYVGFGSGLRLNYKNTAASAQYLYSPSTASWSPSFGISYDILSF